MFRFFGKNYWEIISIDTQLRANVNHCIANDILAEFLREQGGKIVSILTEVYDVEPALQELIIYNCKYVRGGTLRHPL